MSDKSIYQDEDRYHSLFNNMTEGFARCQMIYENGEPIDFIYLEVNNAFEKLTGLKNVVGKRISEIFADHKTENTNLFNLYERVSRTGVSELIEAYVAPLERWFSISGYSSQKGQFLVIFDNITKRKKSEEALRISESKFRGLFIQSHVGTAIVGLDKCFVKCNDALCSFLGYSEKEMIGKTIAYFTYPKDIKIGINEVNRIAKGEIEFATIQKRYLRKDGIVVWGELTISMVKSEDNKPLYFLPVIQDVTERYKMGEAIKESEERFKQLIKNSFDMIVLVDSNGIQHYVSESCEKILGYAQKELISIDVIKKLIHPQDKKKVLKNFLDIVKNKTNGGIQYRHRHKNGSWVYLEAFGTNQLDNPVIKSVILNVRDVTERKYAEQILKKSESSLKELNEAKDKFFSIIAHDLRSPFNAILGFSDLLSSNAKTYDTEKTIKFSTQINSAALNTLALLDNLLNWAKSQTGQIIFKPVKLNLQPIIVETIEVLNPTAELKDIALNYIQSDGIEVYADEYMLKTILRNLITNAIKFTNSKGTIVVNFSQKNNFIEITVSDDGIGMNNETQNKLFALQTNETTLGTANETGSGLGLVLCKELIEKHGGIIWVESEPKEGATFHFTIPNDIVLDKNID